MIKCIFCPKEFDSYKGVRVHSKKIHYEMYFKNDVVEKPTVIRIKTGVYIVCECGQLMNKLYYNNLGHISTNIYRCRYCKRIKEVELIKDD